MVLANMVIKKIDLLFDAEERKVNPYLQEAYQQAINTLIQKVKKIFENIEVCESGDVDEQYIRDFFKK